jgi:hypothetical protein
MYSRCAAVVSISLGRKLHGNSAGRCTTVVHTAHVLQGFRDKCLLLAFLEGGAILSTLCASLPTKEIEEEYYIS